MRIELCVDDVMAEKLSGLARLTGQATVEVIERAIDLYHEQEISKRRPRRAVEVLRSTGFIGSGEAAPDVSSRFKEELLTALGEKYDAPGAAAAGQDSSMKKPR